MSNHNNNNSNAIPVTPSTGHNTVPVTFSTVHHHSTGTTPSTPTSTYPHTTNNMKPTSIITAAASSILIMIANATTTQARDPAWVGNKQVRRPNFTECCNRFVMEVKKGNTLNNCDPTCTDCIRCKLKDGNQEVFNMSICTGSGCSEMRWCGLDNNYKI